jgi:Ca2+-binding EF-hand superfamily protein
VEDGPRSQQQ